MLDKDNLKWLFLSGDGDRSTVEEFKKEMDVWLEDFEGNKIFGLWTPGMIKSCLDLIEAPGLKVNTINPDEEKVGLTINVNDDKQEWLAGFVAGYQMAIEHMRSGK